ncbi:DNA-binding transcriptional MerR regulator [Nocardioides luteus]|uniref:MerR family transcriptional regulator n=1 Tax=Nocardioides luteus TaxID=1844 RepID=A0ABQ5SUH7_9ACTN|nr:MerR family transcriptional regulator [Nocardioides luteus]MDR7309280.1 DNA-binding transcriptional MerR regulator [Nocardioides luteus]GGR69809.1 MerR family transcriptional regulator [Nocardioides luteus]GLJ67685.1 MerR family transcriptional regulator [Nocardioides luteus]
MTQQAHSTGLTIAEVAERTGLTAHTLRYYERDGLMLEVGRNGAGHRAYTERDLGWITLITRLRATGMPIREIRRYAEMVRSGGGNEGARLDLLRAHRDRVRAQLEETAAHLDAIEFKVAYYAAAVGETDPDAELIAQQRRDAPAATG